MAKLRLTASATLLSISGWRGAPKLIAPQVNLPDSKSPSCPLWSSRCPIVDDIHA